MSTTFDKNKLSASTNGRSIKVVATATAGTLIHTSTALTGYNFDEVFLYACNHHTANVTLAIEWGGVASPDDLFTLQLEPLKGLYLDIPGLLLQNSLTVAAFASVANVITINGYVHEIRE